MNRMYLSGGYLNIDITCNRELDHLIQKHETLDDISVVVNILRPKDKEDMVSVIAWAGKVGDKETLIFKQDLPFEKNQNYNISYNFNMATKLNWDKVIDNTRVNDVFRILNVPLSKDNQGFVYSCTQFLSPQTAKRRYKYLRKKNLISKTFWDKYINFYDILCEACHVEGSAYTALSVPSYGRVKLLDEKCIDLHPKKYIFNYDGQWYGKIPEKLWYLPSFYNKKEFKELSKKYEPHGEFLKWENFETYESLLGNKSRREKNYPDFDIMWEKCGRYWTDRKGHYENFGGHLPPLGTWERVVSPNYYDWLQEYDFDKMWNISLTEEKIESHGNIYGGAYRVKDRIEDNVIVSKDNKIFKKSQLEKVVTKGWHSTPYPHSIECPVCKEMWEITRASRCWLPPFWNVRNTISYYVSKIKLRLSNLKYRLQKKLRAR